MVRSVGSAEGRRRRRPAYRLGALEMLEPRALLADGISPAPVPPLRAVAGIPLSDAVFATYTVTDTTTGPGDQWRALINFGDGQADGPLIPVAQGGGFAFVDTHTYKSPGTYTVTVLIAVPGSHRPNDNTVTTTVAVTSTAGGPTPTPTPPAAPEAAGLTLKARADKLFHGRVATVDEAGATARGFTAWVDWGDQSPPTPGRIRPLGRGRFAVIAAHRYAAPGSYVVNAAIRDASGRQVIAASRMHVVRR
jgi:hypothetical protein